MNSAQETNPSVTYAGAYEEKSYCLVLFYGLASTALALFGVYLLDRTTTDFHIMGWYANYVLPIGALIVGIVASSGYGLASWFSGIKITRGLLWLVLGLQFLAYLPRSISSSRASTWFIRRPARPLVFLNIMTSSRAPLPGKSTTDEPVNLWGSGVTRFAGLRCSGLPAAASLFPPSCAKSPTANPASDTCARSKLRSFAEVCRQ